MIYINSESTIVKFPQTSQLTADRIRFINQTTKQSFEVEVSDYSGFSNVYAFNIQEVIRFFETGQYDYLIFSGSEIIDRGIVQFGSFEHKTSQYDARVDIIQYSPDEEYTPLPKRVKDIKNNGVYDVDGVDKVKVDVANLDIPDNTKFAYSIWSSIPKDIKTIIRNYANCGQLFSYCGYLESADLILDEAQTCASMFSLCTRLEDANIRAEKATIFESAFNNCKSLKTATIYAPSVTAGYGIFSGCDALLSVDITGCNNLVRTAYMFYGCKSIKSIKLGDLSKVTGPGNINYMFQNCTELENLEVEALPSASYSNWRLEDCTKLTVDSLMNIINALPYRTGTTSTCKIGSANLAKLSDDQISIATDKGWRVI